MNNKSLTMLNENTQQEHKCSGCNLNPELPVHTCPYKSDMFDDEETMCNCCNDCWDDCVASI